MISERRRLKSSLKKAGRKEKVEITNLIKIKESEISNRMEEENYLKVSENFKTLSDTSGSINTNGMWG